MQHASTVTSSDTASPPPQVALSADGVRETVRRMVAGGSVLGVAKRLGMNRSAILSLAAPDATPRAGTIALARERIAASAAPSND